MEDKWLKKLRDKVNDHDPQHHDDFWGSIEDRIFPQEEEKIVPIKKFPIARLVTFAASIAACLLVIFVSFYVLENNSDPSDKNQIAHTRKHTDQPSALQDDFNDLKHEDQKGGELSQKMDPVSMGTPSTKPNNADVKLLGRNLSRNKTLIADQIGNVKTDVRPQLQPAVANDNIAKPDVADTNAELTISKFSEENSERIREGKILEDLKLNKKTIAKAEKPGILKIVGAGLLSAGIVPGAGSIANGYSFFDGGLVGSDSTNTGGSGPDYLSDVLQGNQDRPVSSTVRKNKSISLGISVNTDLTKKWTLSSGLFYTKLSSKIDAGSDEYNYSIKQVSHYIGIPVQLNYRFVNKPKVRVYVAAGGQIDFAIASKQTDVYELEGTRYTEIDPSYKAQPIKFSILAAPGIEYRFNKNLGFYIEPGIRYFFMESTGMGENVQRNPANFSLRTGLRYTICPKD